MSFVKRAAGAVVLLLKREPVATWGVVVAAVLGALPSLGVPASIVTGVSVALPLLGVPVVRSKVTPVDALKALYAGLIRAKAVGPASTLATPDDVEMPVPVTPPVHS